VVTLVRTLLQYWLLCLFPCFQRWLIPHYRLLVKTSQTCSWWWNCPPCVQPEGSLPFSKQSNNCPYPKASECNPCLEVKFQYYPPIYT
jgi:hypothetical protein